MSQKISPALKSRKNVSLLIAALAVAMLVVALVAPAAAGATTTRATLTGHVTGEGGTPVVGAKVQVLSGTTVVARSATGWAGRYSVHVPAGSYEVKFSRQGYEAVDKPGIEVTAPSTTLDVTMNRLPKLTGKVTGSTGAPLFGVHVQVLSGTTVVARGETGWKGLYSVYVPAGTYEVKFTRRGYQTVDKPGIEVTAPSITLDATLTKLP